MIDVKASRKRFLRNIFCSNKVSCFSEKSDFNAFVLPNRQLLLELFIRPVKAFDLIPNKTI